MGTRYINSFPFLYRYEGLLTLVFYGHLKRLFLLHDYRLKGIISLCLSWSAKVGHFLQLTVRHFRSFVSNKLNSVALISQAEDQHSCRGLPEQSVPVVLQRPQRGQQEAGQANIWLWSRQRAVAGRLGGRLVWLKGKRKSLLCALSGCCLVLNIFTVNGVYLEFWGYFLKLMYI